ncbi:MAG: helix-turn-helix transcriptional regulator [Steroidobacteraceae bacterium]
MQEFTKAQVAALKRVSTRTVDSWVARGLLPKPRKWGTTLQARVRWTDADLAVLERNLAGSCAPQQPSGAAA